MSRLWKGNFASTHYKPLWWLFTTVKGDIQASLPDNIETTSNSPTVLTYTGIYRYGETSSFNFQYTPEMVSGTGSGTGKGYLSGVATTTQQHISFYIVEKTDHYIQGNYTSIHPYDQGTFHLTLVN